MTGIGLIVPQLGPHVTADALEAFAVRAEALGYASLWVQDHFLFAEDPKAGYAGVPGLRPPEQYRTVWAPTELLAALATWTDRVALGTSILVTGNHWPAPLAVRLATVDQLSRGRLIVGLGVGWSKDEHEAVGVDFHTRGRRSEDFVGAMLACWGPDPVAHDGPFFTIPSSSINPKPFGGRVPRLLSGMWSPAGLARTVRAFDGWNPAGIPVAGVAAKVAEMDAERAQEGLAPLQVYHRAFVAFPTGRPGRGHPGIEGVATEVEAAQEADFDEVIVELNFWDEMDSPDAWAAAPDRLAPLLDLVRS